MGPDTCPDDLSVSSQRDIEEGPFATCVGPINNVIVTNTNESMLAFSARSDSLPVRNIAIRDNSNLTSIFLPNLHLPEGEIGQVEISGNPNLGGIAALFQEDSPVRINLSDVHHGRIDLRGLSNITDFYVDNSIAWISNVHSINLLKTTGTALSLFDVDEIQTMDFEHYDAASWSFYRLEKIHTAKWTNVSIGSCTTGENETYVVLEDMVVGPSLFDSPPPILTTTDGHNSSMQFGGLSSIGGNLNITQNNFITLEFPVLEKISGELRIEDNKNCTLLFNKTTSIGSIYAANSSNTALPGWFPELQEVGDIFLSGYIDPSPSLNIFPNLKTVTNSIRIEVWNSDFDCNSFLSRAKDLGYRSPSCNVTAGDPSDGSTDDGPGSSGSGSGSDSDSNVEWAFVPHGDLNSTISQGQWAGIGTGIAVFVISCCFTVYFIVRLVALKKQLRQQQGEQDGQDTAGKGPTANRPDQEVAAKREDMPHEADSAQVVEAAGRELASRPRELGSTVVVAEMWAPNGAIAELP